MSMFHQFSLGNGVAVVVVPLKGLSSVTVEMFLRIGSKYETKNEFGMSHFLEHMAFKGTEKRKTALDLNREIDSKGAGHNAGTGHEWTSYHIKSTCENIPWAIDVLSDILLNSTYPDKEIEKERGVVVEEIRMYDDNPTMGLSFAFLERFLKSDTGCWNITGYVEDIKKINREKVVSYRNKFMSPDRVVVVVAGDIGSGRTKLPNIRHYLDNCFGGWAGEVAKLPKTNVSYNKNFSVILKKDIEQAHFCLGWPGVSWKDKSRYAAKMLEIILLGNSSSKLWNAIREDRGLAYYLFPISEHFEELGVMGIQAGVARDRLDEAIEVTKNELFSLTKTITEMDLVRAKEYLLGKLKLSMDQTEFWSDLVGQRKLLTGEVIGVDELIKIYSEVNLNQIRKFVSDNIAVKNIRCLTLTR